jgi:hypothetical protein
MSVFSVLVAIIAASYLMAYFAFEITHIECRFYFGYYFSLVFALYAFLFTLFTLIGTYLHNRLITNNGLYSFLGLDWVLSCGSATEEKCLKLAEFFSRLFFEPPFLPQVLHGIWGLSLRAMFPITSFLQAFSLDERPRNSRRKSLSHVLKSIVERYVAYVEGWYIFLNVLICGIFGALFKYMLLANC